MPVYQSAREEKIYDTQKSFAEQTEILVFSLFAPNVWLGFPSVLVSYLILKFQCAHVEWHRSGMVSGRIAEMVAEQVLTL